MTRNVNNNCSANGRTDFQWERIVPGNWIILFNLDLSDYTEALTYVTVSFYPHVFKNETSTIALLYD